MKKLFLLLLTIVFGFTCSFAQTDANEEEQVYTTVEKKPEFPGGNDAMLRFINNYTKCYPVASNPTNRGRVVCKFIVEKDGTLSNVEVTRAAGEPFLNSEAVRIIESMPRWTPGRHDDQPVRVLYVLPINFNQ